MASKRLRTAGGSLAEQFLHDFDDDEVEAAPQPAGAESVTSKFIFHHLPESCLRLSISFLDDRECRIKGRVCKSWRNTELQLRVQLLKRSIDSILRSLSEVDVLLPLLARRCRISASELLERLQTEESGKSTAQAPIALSERTKLALEDYNASLDDVAAQADETYFAAPTFGANAPLLVVCRLLTSAETTLGCTIPFEARELAKLVNGVDLGETFTLRPLADWARVESSLRADLVKGMNKHRNHFLWREAEASRSLSSQVLFIDVGGDNEHDQCVLLGLRTGCLVSVNLRAKFEDALGDLGSVVSWLHALATALAVPKSGLRNQLRSRADDFRRYTLEL